MDLRGLFCIDQQRIGERMFVSQRRGFAPKGREVSSRGRSATDRWLPKKHLLVNLRAVAALRLTRVASAGPAPAAHAAGY